jgi:hypothetical protein
MAIQTFTGRIRQRFSTLAAITATNPILLEGEVWTEKDASTGRSTGRRKVGDGVIGAGDVITGTAFNSLPFEPTAGGGSGDVVGPASATDGRAALFDGATGKLLKVSGAAPVLEGDARLTDVRTPAAHNQAASTISDSTTAGRALLTAADATAQRTSLGLGTAATTASTDYAPAAQGVTNGNSHDHNGGDGAQIAYSSLSGLPTLGSLATLSALGAITSAGALGSTANLPIITTTGGALSAGSFGATANTFCQGNDSRLSDARTPTAHNQAFSTITGTPTTLSGYGISDAQPLDSDLTSIAALTTTTYGRSQLALADAAADTAQLNVFSSSLKGLAPSSGGGTSNFLRADGTWATPAGGGGDVTLSGTQTLTNKTFGNYTETVFTITDAAAFEINPNNGPIQLITLGANRTPAATTFAAGQSVTLMINDGTAFAITWTTVGVVWVGGTAPTLATTGWTVIELWKVASTIYGAWVGNVA